MKPKTSNNVAVVAVAADDDDGCDYYYDDGGYDDYGDAVVNVYTVRCSNRLLPESVPLA